MFSKTFLKNKYHKRVEERTMTNQQSPLRSTLTWEFVLVELRAFIVVLLIVDVDACVAVPTYLCAVYLCLLDGYPS